ncbi:MAG: major capsid protein P2 [Stagnimonas sp.]|nr:major capsid protein P2 [Stagnimonas sp.]
MRINVKMPNSNGVAAGQTATFDLPIGRRFHALQLEYSGITLAQMTEIRIIANGEPIHRYSGTQRDVMNQFDGRAAAAGILIIPFDRFNLYEQVGEQATALQTGSAGPDGIAVTSLKMEIDIDAAAAAPAIACSALQSDNDPAAPGPGRSVLRVLPYSRVLGAGQAEISDLPKSTEGPKFLFVNRAFFFNGADITRARVERSGFTIFERSKALNDRAQLDGVRSPQAGLYVIDPTEEGYDYETIALVQPNKLPHQDFRYVLTLSAGATVVPVIEYIGVLGG